MTRMTAADFPAKEVKVIRAFVRDETGASRVIVTHDGEVHYDKDGMRRFFAWDLEDVAEQRYAMIREGVL